MARVAGRLDDDAAAVETLGSDPARVRLSSASPMRSSKTAKMFML